jgi:hypothetical protein
VSAEELRYLESRLGRLHAKQRLGVERDHETQVFGYGRNFFHFENSAFVASVIEYGLKASGLYWRGQRNAARVAVRHNRLSIAQLPKSFSGFTILHLSDLHAEMSAKAMQRAAELLAAIDYDLCVLTGDYRGPTHGPHEPALAGVAELVQSIKVPMYGVLGNHDTMLMVPGLEKMGIHVLLNESVVVERGGGRIHIAGVDDAHFYRADNIERAARQIPAEEFSILLSHTPEIYRQAAHADFNLMLSGHTHGGQICLPGSIAITLDSNLPRRLGAGPWRHHEMHGYTSRGAGTSMVPVRFNCEPEITLHHLECGP